MIDKKNEPGDTSLQPLEKISMTDRVESRLGEYFKSQGLVPGDPIPKELEIAEALGVSRNVVREALSRFKMLGMIETKKRRGMVMTQPDILNSLERVLDPYLLDSHARKEIFELRLVLEMGLSHLLFARIRKEHIAELEEIVQRELNAKSVKERVQCDIDFHATLYKIAGNDILRRFQKLLLPVFDYELSYELKLKDKVSQGKVTHQGLLRILQTGTPQEFESAMYEHLKPHFDTIS
ncbi:FadR family transcriptional regulator [Sinomicrobium pectinilyticum]|uniref:FadR family transcriptional regulator n=1 Tax=Sinomicrobium pectinilyticum TaxID=1084421 RepID=A0A3N0E3B1_SINP1|nr:FCD domain-containing protein [Sinomicrobium pectinilyticum]RNL82283.1 FadR family transcriptional regulator [Sinomicrobium pectinilyticum]